MNTPEGECCENCRFFFQTEPDRELRREEVCRRYPGQGVAAQTPRGMHTMAFFPPTQQNFWCGEWSPGTLIIKQ